MSATTTVFTIGHSRRTAEELLSLLREFGIRRVVDVRRYPVSRRYPHFGQERLAATLAREGIGYEHEPDLGGRRTPDPRSPNTALRQEAFRGYADHMATPVFARALERIRRVAAGAPTALMCAEADPANCHRWLLADGLVTRGDRVMHVLGPGQLMAHTLSPAARPTPEGGIAYQEPGAAQRRIFSTYGRRAARSRTR